MGFRKRLIITSTQDEKTGTLCINYPLLRMMQAGYIFSILVGCSFFCIGVWALFNHEDLLLGIWFTVFPVLFCSLVFMGSYTPAEITPTHFVCLHFFQRKEIPITNIRWMHRPSYHAFTPLFSSWREHEILILSISRLPLRYMFFNRLPTSAGIGDCIQERMNEIKKQNQC